MAESTNGQAAAQADESPIAQVRRRKGKPPAGERGQTHSNFHFFLSHLGRPNPDKLSIDVYRKMEKDPMVRAGLQIRELAVLGKAPAFNYTPLDADDAEEKERGARMVRFLEWVWRNMRPAPVILLRQMLSARRFGFSVMEKVWASTVDSEGRPMLRTLPEDSPFPGHVWIERVKHLPPETLSRNGLATDEYGNLLAVIQTTIHYPRPDDQQYLGGSIPSVDRTPLGAIVFRDDDLRRVIVYTANLEAGNPYGVSDLQAAYNSWYAKQSNHAARNILLERLSGIIIGEYQDEASQEKLEEALENAGPGGILTVPEGTNVDLLKGWEQAVQGYHDAINYDDRQILQSLLVPPLTIGGQTEETGSYARAASNFDSFLFAIRQLQLELEESIEKEFIQPLIDANFPDAQNYPTFDFPELAEKDRESLARVWTAAVNDGYVDPAIDAMWLRQEMGVPENPPDGHVFKKPEPQQDPFGAPRPPAGERGRSGLPRPGTASAQAGDDDQAPRFSEVEAPEANELTVNHYESLLRTALSDAGLDLLDDVLDSLPEDPDRVEDIHVPEAAFREVFQDVGHKVLERVLKQMADHYRELGEDELADDVVSLVTAAPDADVELSDVESRLAAQAPEEALGALQSYLRFVEQFSDLKGRELAETVQSRLRLRALESWNAGLTLQQIRRRLSGEFTSYLSREIDTVSRTTVMDSFNTARNVAYEAAGDYVQGVRFLPLLDTETTPFCRALTGRSIRKSDPHFALLRNPPFFYNCRTITVPITVRDEGWEFDTDWDQWLARHRGDDGGGFLT